MAFFDFIVHCKSKQNQAKQNKRKRDMCKSESIFPYLKILDKVYLKNE